jgi:hypothetical protein
MPSRITGKAYALRPSGLLAPLRDARTPEGESDLSPAEYGGPANEVPGGW